MMVPDPILTTWRGCPQSRLCQEVVARGDRATADVMWQVAQEWDAIMAPNRLVRWLHDRFRPRRMVPERYAVVARAVSDAALRATLAYVDDLRTRPCVRENLRAVAFLERFEAAIAGELERRLSAGRPEAAESGAVTWWGMALTGER